MAKHTLYHRLREYSRDESVRTIAKIYAFGLAAIGATLLYVELKDIPEDET